MLLYIHLVHVVADGPAAEAFLLVDKSFVQHAASVLIRRAEVEIVELAVVLFDEVAEQQVQRSEGTAFLAAGNVLHVGHLPALEDDRTRHDALLAADKVEPYVPGEAAHEPRHFLQRMGGACTVILHQHILQERPELAERRGVALHHAVNVEAMLHGLLRLTDAEGGHLHRVVQRDASAHEPSRQAGPDTEEGVEVLARRSATIYIRYRLVEHALCLHHVATVGKDGLHHVHHLLLRHVRQHDQSAVGQALVRPDGAPLPVPVGREEGHEVPRRQLPLLKVIVGRKVGTDQEGTVLETV